MPGCKAQNIQHRLAKWTGSHRLNHIHTKIDLPSLVLALQFADIRGNEANWKWPSNAWERPQANSLCNQHASSILLHHHYFPFGATGSQPSCKTHSEKQKRKNASRPDVVGLGITYEEQNSKQMVLPQEYPGEYGWTLTEPVPFTMKDVAELLTSTVYEWFDGLFRQQSVHDGHVLCHLNTLLMMLDHWYGPAPTQTICTVKCSTLVSVISMLHGVLYL